MNTILQAVVDAVRATKPEAPPAPEAAPAPVAGSTMLGNALAGLRRSREFEDADQREVYLSDPLAFYKTLAARAKHTDDPATVEQFLRACALWDRAAVVYREVRDRLVKRQIEGQTRAIADAIRDGAPLPVTKGKETLEGELRSRKKGIYLAMQEAVEAAAEPALRLQRDFVASGQRYIENELVPLDRRLADEFSVTYFRSPLVRTASIALTSLRQQFGPSNPPAGLGNPRAWCPWIPESKA